MNFIKKVYENRRLLNWKRVSWQICCTMNTLLLEGYKGTYLNDAWVSYIRMDGVS